MSITINNGPPIRQKVTGITNLGLGLWEFYQERSQKIVYVYVSDPVLVESGDPYFRGAVMISDKIEKPKVSFYLWNERVFTRSDKTITISN
jgi:hypothetical protein